MSSNHTFVSTKEFIDNLEKLSKSYPTCRKDICDELKGLGIDEIYNKKYTLADMGHVKIIKIRVSDSSRGKGKSSGFRIIILVNKKHNHIAFLACFPKLGQKGVDNIEKEESKAGTISYRTEMKTGCLLQLNIYNELKEVVIDQEINKAKK